jgi:Replication-relaxation
MRERGIILTEGVVLGLFFVQRYRFLTIDQFARASGMHRDTASRQLRSLELRGVLSHFGNACLPGHGRTPKVYFLTRKGWELLSRESDIPAELLGSHREVKVDSRWSPQMYHRLRTVDLMISAEVAVRSRSRLSMVATFLEYRRVKRGTRVERETTDYVAKEETSDTRIIPDAAFVMENIESGKRALFFLEMDMGTERIVSQITRDKRISLFHKLTQYDRYLQGMRYRRTYAGYGDFRFFTLLFITIGEQRIENIRREMARLPPEFSDYYRLTTYSQAMGDFFSPIWKSRLLSDTGTYGLVRETADEETV